MTIKDKKIEVILFDFEGTLVDFQWQLRPAADETLSALDKAGFQADWYGPGSDYADIYNRTREIADQGKASFDLSRAMKIIDSTYDRYDADALERWNLYSDTLQTLRELVEAGYILGLVSNIGKNALTRALDKFGLTAYFKSVISRNDLSRLKPDPEGLLKSADILGTKPDKIMLVGDSRVDVQAAKAAGMSACYLSGGENWPQNLPKSAIDLKVDKLSQIIPLLTR